MKGELTLIGTCPNLLIKSRFHDFAKGGQNKPKYLSQYLLVFFHDNDKSISDSFSAFFTAVKSP